ncbi:MAG: hypothetical protein NVSMB9_03670 [Isosphaeraceae bacterium]
MDISLIHTGLAAGAALAALPVVLHLFMRQTPKHVIFPALRLIRERQKRSKKRLRIKNWLLLLARMALLALMALALARPTIVSEASIGDQEVPSAIGLVFDTSLSMGYKQPDKTRLDLAKERAFELLKRTPSSSMVFVVDSADPGIPPGLSPAAARKRIESLTLRAANRSLNSAVGLAYSAVTVSDRPRHEVYVLTDLARSAWDLERTVDGLEKVARDKIGLRTCVLRLTPRDVQDVAVIDARPTSGVVVEGEAVEIMARIRSVGPRTTRVAELWIDGVLRDKKPVELLANGEVEVRFQPLKADPSRASHQGHVRVTGPPDPVDFDDIRYFSFHVKAATNVLVVSDLADDAQFVSRAIDPEAKTIRPGAPRPYRAERISTGKFAEKTENLGKRYRCIFLNNVSALSDADWGRLSAFVREGGGLVVGLGGRVQTESYQGSTALQVLPANVESIANLDNPTTFGQVADYTHPLFSRYSKQLDEMLAQVPVNRYWKATVPQGSRVLLFHGDRSPALIERVFNGPRTGRALLWTTPLSRRPGVAPGDAWSEFPNPLLGWSFFYLMNQSVSYLSGTMEDATNFEAGKDVVLPLDPTQRLKDYIVQDPERKTSERLTPPERSDSLVVVAPQQLGNWSVKASGTEGNERVMGFSLNSPVSETQFAQLDEENLNRLFGGKKQYTLADDSKSFRGVIDRLRVGSELFPWLMFIIMILVTVESVLANRFYKGASAPTPLPEAP